MILIDPINVYVAGKEIVESEPRDILHIGIYDYLNKDLFRSVTGLQPYDLAIFGHLISGEGSDEQDWLVTDYNAGEAVLVNTTPLLDDPKKYTTPHLEKLLKRTGQIEASQLSIDSLIEYVFNTNNA